MASSKLQVFSRQSSAISRQSIRIAKSAKSFNAKAQGGKGAKRNTGLTAKSPRRPRFLTQRHRSFNAKTQREKPIEPPSRQERQERQERQDLMLRVFDKSLTITVINGKRNKNAY